MRTISFNVYTIEEHPHPEKVYEWIRENWHDLNQHSVNDMLKSLEELALKIGATLQCSFSAVPSRGEFIHLGGGDPEKLKELVAGDCPLTGVWTDEEVIRAAQAGDVQTALKALHEDTETVYSDQGLYDHCDANEYEFDMNGKFHAKDQ